MFYIVTGVLLVVAVLVSFMTTLHVDKKLGDE